MPVAFMDKPALMGLRQNSFRLFRLRGQGQRALTTSISNTAAVLIIAFVFVNCFFLGIKLGELIAETETAKQYLDAKSTTKFLRSP